MIDARWHKQLKKFLDLCDEGTGSNPAGVEPAVDDEAAASVSSELASAHPGRIDNSALFNQSTSNGNGEDVAMEDEASASSSSDIRGHMMEELDYVVVPEEAWDLLVKDFGLTQGQTPIARKVRLPRTLVRDFFQPFLASNSWPILANFGLTDN